MINPDTPFMAFWSALNRHFRAQGLPEPTFGPARRAWEDAISTAGAEVRAQMRRAS